MARLQRRNRALFAGFIAALVTACAPSSEEETTPSTEDDLTQAIPFVTTENISALVYDEPNGHRLLPEPDLQRRFGHDLNPPYAQTLPGATMKPWDYLRRMSALSHAGPVGHFGPLGPQGPLGDSGASPDSLISGMFAWSSW